MNLLRRKLTVTMLIIALTKGITMAGGYPQEVETALQKSGKNRAELEKAIDYFREKGDTLNPHCRLWVVKG